jgi:hypothetical protein
MFSVLFWGIWVSPIGLKKVHTDSQVGGMYVSVSLLKNGPLTKLIGPFLRKKWSKTARKWVFMLFWGIWAPPKGPIEVLKGLQVGGMYVPMSKLENKPLTKSIGPFLQEK